MTPDDRALLRLLGADPTVRCLARRALAVSAAAIAACGLIVATTGGC